MTFHADTALAARLESLAAQEMRRFVVAALAEEPESGAVALEVAGGVAAYIGRGCLMNQAFGLGFDGPVTEDDARAVTDFFAERGERAVVSVCPLADGSVLESFAALGYVADTFEQVLVRELAAGDAALAEQLFTPGLSITEPADEEGRSLWAHVAATGFSAPLDPQPAQLELGRLVTRRPGTRLFLAWVDGRPAGTAELQMTGDIAWLSADTTLPHYRGRGIQQALQRHRLAIAARAGCTLAVTEARPGSVSQRNMERLGFSVIYTRVDLLGPELDASSGEGA